MLLVGAMLFTSIPMTATAKTSERKYGDVNGDGEIDFIDVLTLKKYIAEMEPKNYVPENPDVPHTRPVPGQVLRAGPGTCGAAEKGHCRNPAANHPHPPACPQVCRPGLAQGAHCPYRPQ